MKPVKRICVKKRTLSIALLYLANMYIKLSYVYTMVSYYTTIPKGRWIVDAKRRVINLALFTDPVGDSWFSIY